MSGNALPGHGTLLGVNTIASPQVFTDVAELIDVKTSPLRRPTTETTPHNAKIDCHSTGVLQRDPITFMVNYLFSETTHSDLISSIDANETLGWIVTEPTGSPGAGEWIGSGEIILFDHTTPVRNGQITAAISVQLSGPMIIDGNAIGAS